MSRRRLVRTAAVAVSAVTCVGLAGGTASAAPTTGSASLIPPGTVYSLPGIERPHVDILVARVRYDRTAGSVTASLTLRGAPVPSVGGGPIYGFTLTGPGYIGQGPSISIGSRGAPPVGRGSFQGDQGQAVPIAVRATVNGSTVTFTATDPILRNQPVTRYEVVTNNDGFGGVTSGLQVDYAQAPLG
jgi:hypothetical protein